GQLGAIQADIARPPDAVENDPSATSRAPSTFVTSNVTMPTAGAWATMRRREFLGLLGSAACGWPAHAQQGERIRRVAALVGGAESDSEMRARLAAFRYELEQLGWLEGRSIRIDHHFAAAGPDQYERIARELVALRPEVILAHTTPVALALRD